MSVVIHHNPDCGTSRNVLAIIKASGVEPVVIPYLDTGWTRGQLLGLFAAAGLTPRSALRVKRSPAEALGLLDPDVDDEALLAAMLAPIHADHHVMAEANEMAPAAELLAPPAIYVTDTSPRPLQAIN